MTARGLDDLLEETEQERNIAITRAEAAEQRATELSEQLRLAKIDAQSAWDSEAQWKSAADRIEAECAEWKALYEVIDNTAHTNVLRADKAEAERDEARRQLEQAQKVYKHATDWVKDTDECLFCGYPYHTDGTRRHEPFCPLNEI